MKLPIALFLTSGALLLVVTPLLIPFDDADATERSRTLAKDGLARIMTAERTVNEATKHFVPFGPTDSERSAALGPLDLGPAADLFSFDTLIDRAGRLHLRAISRATAVRAGRVAPVLESADLDPVDIHSNTKP